ncbi:hypothetical protein K3888_11160 [Dietzia aurantiaca]|uniref:hypothetical protein n=1 Tax=Dietzia aurantiaca TaxID=983873 RepID=UPI001E45882F|nr:hypothetical protein [Dietzia aurantiaca]MCD2263256.1 hypothetical protein [Dietzia aurantiaca]
MSDPAGMVTFMRYHPWRHLRDHTHVTVETRAELPTGVDGFTDGTRIWLRRGLTQAQRRSVLAHELVHIERGTNHVSDREEAVVDSIAARRLVTFLDLHDALRWSQGRVDDETADWCWVDLRTIEARIESLTDAERAQLEQLREEWAA